jgi:RimJ/RimL family protein N-acetyltransferase
VVGVAAVENLASRRVMAKAGMALQGPYAFGGRRAALHAVESTSANPRG